MRRRGLIFLAASCRMEKPQDTHTATRLREVVADLVADRYGTAWELAPAGSARVDHGRIVDEHTRLQVASMSRWLTAWGVMALAEEGRRARDQGTASSY